MKWSSLHNHSHFSLLDGLSTPIQIVEKAVQYKMPSVALTDHGSIAGCVQFIIACDKTCECGHNKDKHGTNCCYHCKECVGFNKAKIKPILGTVLNICEDDLSREDKQTSQLVVLAKNMKGWQKLVEMTSFTNIKNHFFYKPRITLKHLSYFTGDLIGISGHVYSHLANTLFENHHIAYLANTKEKIRGLAQNKTTWRNTVKLAGKYQEIFGKDNFFIAVNRMDHQNCAVDFVSEAMRHLSTRTGILTVATSDTHYPDYDDAENQLILVCSALQTNFDDINKKLRYETDTDVHKFLKSRNYYIPSPAEIEQVNSPEEVENSERISNACEVYNIFNKPLLPIFDCPNQLTPDQYMEELCAEGWNNKIEGKIPEDQAHTYHQRLKMELDVIEGAGLSSYFLIVQDYIKYARSIGCLVGSGRGSSAGSMLAHLLDITRVDPIKAGLIFERFFNAGRSASLPDIDTDFEKYRRDEIRDYVKNKLGHDKVSPMITFHRLQGRSSLTEVFSRKYPSIPFSLVKKITLNIPDEAKIADQLQVMRDAGEEPSIIMWALENNKKALQEYCYIDEQGSLQGEYKIAFEHAIKLEGVKKVQSKHASGLAVASVPLHTIVPMVYDKSSDGLMAGFEMEDLEPVGVCKLDLLGTTVLDKVHADM